MLTGIFCQFKPRSISESDKLSYCSQYSGSISRIETAVMESSAVHFYTANRSGRITQGRRQPTGQTAQSLLLFSCIRKHHSGDELRHQ